GSDSGIGSSQIRAQGYGRLSGENFASAEPENKNYGATEHELQGRPEHPHEADEFQAAADVFFILFFERFNFRFLLDIGANQARSRKVFLRARGNIGEHGLNALETLVNATAESLNHDADCGQRKKGEEG